VLMLYIETKINGVQVQSFVDSGAQTSVMTLACAKKCGLDKLIDRKYSGKIVGVGQSVSLGKIYIAPIQIGNSYFPMSVTVMESMGDKNMEFLFGLDMLKRHRFTIDLERGMLSWKDHDEQVCSTPFLHEKDLPQHKGGTIGFDPNRTQESRDQEEADQEEEEASQLKKALDDSALEQPRQTEPGHLPKVSAQSMIPSKIETDASTPPVIQSAPSPVNTEHEVKVNRLMAMGFSRGNVERVLEQLDGDEDTAATCLMFEGFDAD